MNTRGGGAALQGLGEKKKRRKRPRSQKAEKRATLLFWELPVERKK